MDAQVRQRCRLSTEFKALFNLPDTRQYSLKEIHHNLQISHSASYVYDLCQILPHLPGDTQPEL